MKQFSICKTVNNREQEVKKKMKGSIIDDTSLHKEGFIPR